LGKDSKDNTSYFNKDINHNILNKLNNESSEIEQINTPIIQNSKLNNNLIIYNESSSYNPHKIIKRPQTAP
jgi:hypothetical protein